MHKRISMQSDKKEKRPLPKAMLDFDGVTIDDITPHINKRFPNSDKGFARPYTELLFNLLRPFKNAGARLITPHEIRLEKNATEFMRTRTPSDLILCTSNTILEKAKLKLALEKEGVHGISIHTVPNKNKIEIAKMEGATLVEDDPFVAIEAARKGVRVILFKRKYNKSIGKLLPHINRMISNANSWDAVAKILSES